MNKSSAGTVGHHGSGTSTAWAHVLFVCGKCMARHRRPGLREQLLAALAARRRNDIQVIAAGCLNICSNRGISVIRSNGLMGDFANPGDALVVDNVESVQRLCDWACVTTPQ